MTKRGQGRAMGVEKSHALREEDVLLLEHWGKGQRFSVFEGWDGIYPMRSCFLCSNEHYLISGEIVTITSRSQGSQMAGHEQPQTQVQTI